MLLAEIIFSEFYIITCALSSLRPPPSTSINRRSNHPQLSWAPSTSIPHAPHLPLHILPLHHLLQAEMPFTLTNPPNQAFRSSIFTSSSPCLLPFCCSFKKFHLSSPLKEIEQHPSPAYTKASMPTHDPKAQNPRTYPLSPVHPSLAPKVHLLPSPHTTQIPTSHTSNLPSTCLHILRPVYTKSFRL